MHKMLQELRLLIDEKRKLNTETSFLSEYEDGFRSGVNDTLDDLELIISKHEKPGTSTDINDGISKFSISKVEDKYDDTCEQCDNKDKSIHYLKGKNDNLDTMLCENCLKALQRTLNTF